MSTSKHRVKKPPPELHPAGRRSDEGRAFMPDPYDGGRAPARADETLAETLAEEFIASATNAEEAMEEDRDAFVTEEIGGPFTETSAAEEFAGEPDESNPIDGDQEPFPTATRHQPS
jgi:hypothetical protein